MRLATLLLTATVLAACAGCDAFERRREVPPEEAPPPPPRSDPLFDDTVGAKTLLTGNEPLTLRGFGVVVGLGDRGGRDCPTPVREYLIEYFNKQFTPGSGLPARRPFSPARLIDSSDSAVVEIRGVVTPGAPRGTDFDVQLAALGSDTLSLVGGLLLPCELKIFQPDASGRGVIAGRALARAAGAVFTNPYADPDDTAALRRGFVLAGARTLEPRNVRLLLEEPSYAIAARIERSINERFGQSPQIATAQSAGYVELVTPPAYADRPILFHRLVGHLLLQNEPAYIDRKLLELTEALGDSTARLPNIALVWEAIGARATATLAGLYGHSDPRVRLYAAQSGLRIGDVDALPVLVELARAGDEDLRRSALREIGDSGLVAAARQILALAADDEQTVRVAAYDALRDLRSPSVAAQRFHYPLAPYPAAFTLDVVAAGGPPLIYARRAGDARIAVFGADQAVTTPMFYSSPDGAVTINANTRGDQLTILAVDAFGQSLPPLRCNPRVIDLIATLAGDPDGRATRYVGAGLGYSQIITVLDGLAATGAIAAEVMLERATIEDLLGPSRPSDRPLDQRREADAPRRSDEPEASEPPADSNEGWEREQIRRAFEDEEPGGG